MALVRRLCAMVCRVGDDAAGDVPGRLRDAAGYVLHWTADGARHIFWGSK